MTERSFPNINDLPVDCIAKVLSLTSPKDACRMSVVDSTFRLAAESDDVWERFLPSDYRDIISCSFDGSDSLLQKFQSKKDLYLHLSDHPIHIDSGIKSFKLEKWSGKKCYMLAARDLDIDWGDSADRYWGWKSRPKSTFWGVAELWNGRWSDIRGRINTKMLSFDTNYAAYLVFTTNSRRFGEFECAPAADACDGIKERTACSMGDTEFLNRRKDGWMEVELGEYFVKGGEDDIEISLLELKKVYGERSLIIQGIEIRPKKCT